MIQRAGQHGAHANIGARDPTIEYLWRDRLQNVNASAVCGISGSRAQGGLKWPIPKEDEVCIGKPQISLRFEQLFKPTVRRESTVIEHDLRRSINANSGAQLGAA